jgi:hypothetical protein
MLPLAVELSGLELCSSAGFADFTPYPYFNFTLNFNLTRHKYPRFTPIIF